MTVVQSKTIKHPRHLLNILLHMLPCIWRISWFIPISDSDQVSPNVNSSSEVIKLFRKRKVLSTVSSSYPSIIQGPKKLFWTVWVVIVLQNSGKILRNKWIRVIKISVVVMKIIMSDFIHSIDYNLRYPFVFYFLYPSGVVVIYGHFEVGNFIGDVQLFPLFYVFQLHLTLLCALVTNIGFNKVFNQFNRILSKQILRRLPWSHCCQ